MVEPIGLGKLASDAMKSTSGSILQIWWRRRAFLDFAEVARESLRRELRFALELLSLQEYGGDDAVEAGAAIDRLLDCKCFDALCDSGVPLSRLLGKEVPKDIWENREIGNPNRVQSIIHEHHLIERTYMRLKVIKVRRSLLIGEGDIGYLKELILASLRVLNGYDKGVFTESR